MKCECDSCQGIGTYVCPDCDGTGEVPWDFDKYDVPFKHIHFKELSALKDEKNKAIADFKKICALNPQHAASYQMQLSGALEAIDNKAFKLI